MTRVAVLGASAAAAQIGCEYALGGCSVTWFSEDVEPQVRQALRAVAQHGLAGPIGLERARALMSRRDEAPADRLALIVEALDEPAPVRAQAISQLAGEHPEALVVSTDPVGSVTELARAAGVGERCCLASYGDPPLLSPLVEVLAARDTPPRLLQRLTQLLRAIGKRPVVLRGEVPGLVATRLELALLRECLSLLAGGIAGAEQLEEVVRDGLAVRWRTAGPLASVSLEGREAFAARVEAIVPTLAQTFPAEALGQLDSAAADAVRERRDELLAAELRARRAGSQDGP